MSTIVEHITSLTQKTLEVSEDTTYVFVATGSAAPNITLRLTKPGVNATLIGLYAGRGTDQQTIITRVVHLAPRTSARTVIRGLVTDQATNERKGMIEVTEAGRGTDSYLSDHSLLLSNKAKSHTTPSLEIKTDEVKCSHGASVAKLSEDQLWYLRSRGVNEEGGRKLLLEGFFRSAIEELSEIEQQKILEKLSERIIEDTERSEVWQNS